MAVKPYGYQERNQQHSGRDSDAPEGQFTSIRRLLLE